MIIDWVSFAIGVGATITVTVAFFVIYIKLAERRLKKLLDDEGGKG